VSLSPLHQPIGVRPPDSVSHAEGQINPNQPLVLMSCHQLLRADQVVANHMRPEHSSVLRKHSEIVLHVPSALVDPAKDLLDPLAGLDPLGIAGMAA